MANMMEAGNKEHERDPRSNPARGDVLRRGAAMRVVLYVLSGIVCFIHFEDPEHDWRTREYVATQWKSWASEATVLYKNPQDMNGLQDD